MRDTLTNIYQYLYKEDKRTQRWLSKFSDWVVVVVFTISSLYFISNYTSFTSKYQNNITTIFTILLTFFVLRRYVFHNGDYPLSATRPFYTCNISAIILSLGFTTSLLGANILQANLIAEILFAWGAFLGVYGGALAILFASPVTYSSPQIMGLEYYIEHVSIHFLGLIYIFNRTSVFLHEVLIGTTILTVVYLLLMNHFNPKLNANYGYISSAPRGIEFMNALPKPLYKTLVILVYTLFNYLSFSMANNLILAG